MTHRFVVITGNPVQGFFFYGPFRSEGKAMVWAAKNQDQQHWLVAPLADPKVDPGE